MATNRAIRRSPAFVVVLAVSMLLAAAAQAPARAQGDTPPTPVPAPADPLALDSNPHTAPAAPPSNDNFDQAWTVGSLTYRMTENTLEATTQTSDPSQTCNSSSRRQGSHSVWFVYAPAATAVVTVTTYGSNYDTVLSIHTGSWGSLGETACNDDIKTGLLQSVVKFTATAGTTYYIDVTSYGTSVGGALVLSARTALPPPNDDFAQAATVSVPLPYAASLDATSALTQPEDPLQGGGGHGDCTPPAAVQNEASVWYRYTALNVTPVTAYTYDSSYDTVLSVHTGSWPGLSEVVCGNDQYPMLQSQVTFTPTLGTPYYLEITRDAAAYEPPIDWLVLNVVSGAPPPNDNFAGARLISETLYGDSVDAALATLENADPMIPATQSCPAATTQYSQTVWYRFSPTYAATFVVDTVGSTYDTVLAAWAGTTPGTLANIGCNDDYGGLQSRLNVQLQAGTTYYIEIASKGIHSAGQLSLNARAYATQWQDRAPLAVGRDRLAAAGAGDYVFIIGGERYVTDGPEASYVPTTYMTRYDPATNLYTEMQPLPVALQDHDAVSVGGRIYVPAGYAGSGPPFYGTHLVYDVATNAWSTAAPAPWPSGRPPVYYSLASDGQGYYLTGGYDGAYILQNVWYYRIATNSWSARAPLPNPRFGHESAYLGGYLYVVAGDNDSVLPGLFSTQRYDPASNTWIQVASQNYDRLFASSGVLPAAGSPGKWYLTGGGFSSYGYGSPLGATEVFDPAASAWELLPVYYDLIVPRYHLAGAVHGNELFAIGGYVGGVPGIVDTNERLVVAIPTAVQVTAMAADMPPVGLLALAGLLGLGALLALSTHRARR